MMYTYRLGENIAILAEDKSPHVFDYYVEVLVSEIKSHGSVISPHSEPSSPKLKLIEHEDYRAISSKVCGFFSPPSTV
jgi:hypothetical protein